MSSGGPELMECDSRGRSARTGTLACSRPVRTDQDLVARPGPDPATGQLTQRLAGDLDLIDGGVGARAAGAQLDREGLPGAGSAVVDGPPEDGRCPQP